MPERPIYYTTPNPEQNPIASSRLQLIAAGAGMGVFTGIVVGAASAYFGGPEAGLRMGTETGLAMGSFMSGIILWMPAKEKAVKFAEEGRKRRAYVEALRGSLESALSLAVSFGTVGLMVGDVPGAVAGGVLGAFIGLGTRNMIVTSVERTLQSKKS